MKYDYHFNNETITIEVTKGNCDILIELDRLERNVNQKETRRHASLDAFNLDGNLFPSDVDVEAECIQNEEYQALYKAIDQLLPQQQELIKKVFFEKCTIVSIAREEGVGESAIRDRLNRIYKKLKEILK
jgi:RNA polymerase sigma factor (sigma-70 family)